MHHLNYQSKLKRWYRLLSFLSFSIALLIIIWTALSAMVIYYAYAGGGSGLLLIHWGINLLVVSINLVVGVRMWSKKAPPQLDQGQFKYLAHQAQISFTLISTIMLLTSCIETVIIPSLIDQKLR